MFLTKKDVDKHCQEVMSKCKNEKDRNLRCLNIAQQYYNVRDYESARRYIISFLSIKDDSPVAHKLFAQCLEYFGEKEKAVSEYKYSLSLDSKQPELYLKVCELYADSSVVVDKNEAKYWHDKAEVQFPYHPAVQKLKKKMFAIGDSQNGTSIESILRDEVKEKPNDTTTHTKLLNFYIDNGRLREAYDQAFKKKISFVPNLFWYQSCVQICKSYKNQFPTSLGEEFYGNYLIALERSLALSVQDVKMRRVSIPEGVALLASFDETLLEATALKNQSERFLLILNHMYGQLCFQTAHILYRKAKWEDNNWPEMIKLISPLLLLSTASRFDIRGAKEEGLFSQILKICILNSIYRIQQAGYILTALVKQSPKHFLEKIFHFCVSSYWKERICEIIYNTSNYKSFSKTSFFMIFDGFSNLPDELPKNVTDDIDKFLSVSETLYPSSLHHLVWVGVQYLNISNKNSICDLVLPLKFSPKFTGSLQFSPNSSSSYAENLSKIDIEAFLFACVYCAKSSLDHQMDKSKPLASHILPADVSRQLCSPEQDLWWDYVNQMINQTIAEEHYSRARATIQRGIENIRLVRRQVLPLHLLVLLGRTFANKATIESDSVRASDLESRSLLYWKAALPLLEKALQKESYLISSKSMFEYQEIIITPGDAAKLISEGKRFTGMLNCKEKNYSDSIFLNESFEEPRPGASTSFSPAAQSLDDALLKTVLEQNTKIMDKLETLYYKQELLSSNQFQLFETISALSKKIDDVLIMPNDCYLDALSASEQPASPHTASQVTNTNVNNKPAPSVPVQPLIGNNFYPLPGGVQTNFPMFPPLGHTPLVVPTTAAFPAFLSQYIQTPPSLPQAQHFQFIPDAKESFSTTNRSIASSCLFNTNTPPAVTPAGGPSTFTSSVLFNETLDQHTSQAFGDSKLFQNTFSNSIKLGEVLPTTSTTRSLSFSSKPSFIEQPTSLPVSVTVASTVPHSFQIPNVVNSSVLFPSVQVPEEDEESSDGDTVEHDPIPDFKPIIPLPDEVELITGEEGEDILFESRAKLYRFVEKEWKERGVGPLKILKNKVIGRVRILMRREVVHKICANHYLMENMNLTAKGDLAWIYCAIDFADEKTREEKLCVKFQTQEIANEFFRVFNENKLPIRKTTIVEKLPQQTPVASPLSKPSTPVSTSSPLTAVGDGAKKIVIAPAVLNVRSPKEKTAESSKTQFGGFTFNAKPILTAVQEKKETIVVDDKIKTPFASFSGFSLNTLSRSDGESKLFSSNAAPPSAPAIVKSEEKSSMLFSTAENAIDFSTLSSNADGAAFAKSKDFKGFAGAGAPVFGMKSAQAKPAEKTWNFTGIPKSSPGQTAGSPKTAESPHDENNDGEYVPTAEFTPVIPLPELIEVITGEEGLEVLYGEQCKLFRFTDDQWKERGVGKMKILRDPKDGTIRLLMRRDQVHKVCCNQRLTPNHELKTLTTTDKAWSWVGKDFSEGELKDELLCVRFKTAELATAFKKAFDDAKARLSEGPECSGAPTTTDSALPPLSTMFKRDQSMWECKACYVSNKKDNTVCVACDQPKDGTAELETSKTSIVDASGGSFKFSTNSTVATSTSTTTWSFSVPVTSAPTAFSFGMPTLTTGASTGVSAAVTSTPTAFSFGLPSLTTGASTGVPAAVTSTSTAFSFGTSTLSTGTSSGVWATVTSAPTAFSFGQPLFGTRTGVSATVTSTPTAFSFDTPLFGASTGVSATVTSTPTAFSFGMPTLSTGTSSGVSTAVNLSQDGASSAHAFSFGNMAQKSESSGLLFGNNSFLFRDKSTPPSKSPGDTVESPPEKKSGTDFSNGSIFGGTGGNNFPKSAENSSSLSKFSLKLPKNSGDNSFNVEESKGEKQSDSSVSKPSSPDDVEFVSETKIPEDEKKLATSLKLPPNYFAYKYSDKNCPGCVGCDEEDRKVVGKESNKTSVSHKSPKHTDSSTNMKNPSDGNLTTSVLNPIRSENVGFSFGGSAGTTSSNSWLNGSTFNFGNIFNRSNVPASENTPKKPEEDESDSEKDTVAPNENDPYFEPIVPLPNLIETKTGEEDEIIQFCERSKLFRYDEDIKEWKERGVGELKVLFHPIQRSYRLLLRREQVLKVVLNQRITATLNLQPLSSSTKCFCWFGMNLPEEQTQPVLEKLAVRFKTEEISIQFKDVIAQCVAQLVCDQGQENDASGGAPEDDEYEVSSVNEEEEEEEGEYGENEYDPRYYVDVEGIQDAMVENSEVVFDSPVIIKIFEADSAADYNGIIRLLRRIPDAAETEDFKTYVDFSTHDVPSLYYSEIDKNSQVFLENDCVTILEDDPEAERKVTIQFPEKELSEEFYNIYEMIK